MIDCFSSKGYGVYVLSSVSPSRLEVIRHRTYGSAQILRLPLVFQDGTLVRLLSILTFFLYTILILQLLRITTLILSIPPEDPCLGSFLAGRFLRKRMVIDCRDEYGGSATNPILYVNVPYYRSMLEHADKIVALTHSFVRNLQNSIRNEQIVYIPNVADTGIFKPSASPLINEIRNKLGLNFDDFILIYTGILSSHTYNVENILQSVEFLVEKGISNIKLLIAGHGPSKEAVLTMAKALGIDDHLVYLGVIKDPHTLSEIISSADIGLVPYTRNILLKNCVPMKFFEYCSCSVPVIATAYRDSEITRIIINNQLGLVSDPDSPFDLSLKIEKLYCDRNYRKELSKNARIFIEKYHNKHTFCSKYLQMVDFVQRISTEEVKT